MNQNTKYFGMTVTQIGILAGLAILVLVLFCVVGFLILGKVTGLSAPQQTAVPTATPSITFTPTITLTPTQTFTPGPTALPYELLVTPGWAQQKTALFEFWMIPGYKPAKSNTLIMGLGGAPVVGLELVGSAFKKSPNKIYITVAYEPLTKDSLDVLFTERLSQLGTSISLSERSKVKINTLPAVRLIFSGRKGNTDINELTYVILDGTTIWYVQYTAELTEFYQLLPVFEASAQTFRVVK